MRRSANLMSEFAKILCVALSAPPYRREPAAPPYLAEAGTLETQLPLGSPHPMRLASAHAQAPSSGLSSLNDTQSSRTLPVSHEALWTLATALTVALSAQTQQNHAHSRLGWQVRETSRPLREARCCLVRLRHSSLKAFLQELNCESNRRHASTSTLICGGLPTARKQTGSGHLSPSPWTFSLAQAATPSECQRLLRQLDEEQFENDKNKEMGRQGSRGKCDFSDGLLRGT